MAINDKDVENAKPLRARFRERVQKANIGMLLKEPFRIDDFYYRTPAESVSGMFGFMAIGISAVAYLGMQTDFQELTIYPQEETTIHFDAQLDEGEYFAVTQDGHSGYAIFNNEGRYRVYEFDGDGVGHLDMKYISDNSESWHIARSIAGDYGDLLAAYTDPDIPLETDAWEVVRFEGLTKFIQQEDGDIIRYFSDVVDVPDTENVGTIFAEMEQLWHSVSVELGEADNAFTLAEIHDDAGTLTTQREYWASETYQDEAISGGLLTAGLLLSIGGAIGPYNRRRKNQPRF
jgi:hypothetical protein